MIITAVLFRLVFIASRSDWHGGFCLGPRYLVVVIPFLLLPIACWLKEVVENGQRIKLMFFGSLSFACIAQQIYFSLGEVFTYYHQLKWNAMKQSIDLFADSFIYLSWDLSTLLYLLRGYSSPFMLNHLSLTNYTLWGTLSGIAALLLFFYYFKVIRKMSEV